MWETISNQFDDISTNRGNVALGQMKWNEKSGSTGAAINQTHIQIFRFFGPIDWTQASTAYVGFESATMPSSVCNGSDCILGYFSSAKWLRKTFRTANTLNGNENVLCDQFVLQLQFWFVTIEYITVSHTNTYIFLQLLYVSDASKVLFPFVAVTERQCMSARHGDTR